MNHVLFERFEAWVSDELEEEEDKPSITLFADGVYIVIPAENNSTTLTRGDCKLALRGVLNFAAATNIIKDERDFYSDFIKKRTRGIACTILVTKVANGKKFLFIPEIKVERLYEITKVHCVGMTKALLAKLG